MRLCVRVAGRETLPTVNSRMSSQSATRVSLRQRVDRDCCEVVRRLGRLPGPYVVHVPRIVAGVLRIQVGRIRRTGLPEYRPQRFTRTAAHSTSAAKRIPTRTQAIGMLETLINAPKPVIATGIIASSDRFTML